MFKICFHYWLIFCNNVLEAFLQFSSAFPLLFQTQALIMDLTKYRQKCLSKKALQNELKGKIL